MTAKKLNNKISAKFLEFLKKLSLKHGSHDETEKEFCVMEAVAYVAGEPHSDHPKCASPVITNFLIGWNDRLPTDEDRDRLLKPLIPLIVGTRSTMEVEEQRRQRLRKWVFQEAFPMWLDNAGFAAESKLIKEQPTLENLRAIRETTWAKRQEILADIRAKAKAAYLEAKSKNAAAVAAADAVADAAAVAAADADAVADADADAVADADAAADAVADAVADAAAVAAADADAAADAVADAAAVAAAVAAAAADAAADAAAVAAAVAAAAAAAAADYGLVYKKIHAAVKKAALEKLAPTSSALQASAVELVKELCAMGQTKESE